MQVMFRPPQLFGVLLLLAAPLAQAESPMPEPIAPAVIGRPLDQIRPARAVRSKSAAAKPIRRKPVVATTKAVRPRQTQTASVRVAPPAVRAAPAPQPVARQAAPAPRLAAVQPAPAPQHAGVQPALVPQQLAKQAPDSRAAPTAQLGDGLGKGARFAGKPFGPGSYFSTRDQALVRRYYETHPASGPLAKWKIGEPIPPKAALTGVPDDLRAALTALPAGHQYVQVDGDVVMVAVQSRVVVDGISRSVGQAPAAASLSLAPSRREGS